MLTGPELLPFTVKELMVGDGGVVTVTGTEELVGTPEPKGVQVSVYVIVAFRVPTA